MSADPHANVFDNARDERDKAICLRVLHWVHFLEDRDGTMNAHKLSIAFHGKSLDIRAEEHLETITFSD